MAKKPKPTPNELAAVSIKCGKCGKPTLLDVKQVYISGWCKPCVRCGSHSGIEIRTDIKCPQCNHSLNYDGSI